MLSIQAVQQMFQSTDVHLHQSSAVLCLDVQRHHLLMQVFANFAVHPGHDVVDAYPVTEDEQVLHLMVSSKMLFSFSTDRHLHRMIVLVLTQPTLPVQSATPTHSSCQDYHLLQFPLRQQYDTNADSATKTERQL
jgi:hypothetical protein